MVSLFVTFEGGEGAGKSTQAQLLTDRLIAEGRAAVRLHEPGGTPLGEHLRGWLKDPSREITAEAELFLFEAARAELVRTVVRPAIEAGTAVVLDRYADSSTAYQGYGRKLSRGAVGAANVLATGGLQPDLTILLDAPPGELLRRAAGRSDPASEQRFELADTAFHRRVRAGFLRLARRSPTRWLVLDAREPPDRVAELVWASVRGLLDPAPGEQPPA